MIQVYFSAHLTGTRRLTVTLIKHVFQHLLVLLHKPSSAVIAKYAQEHILVVGEMSHILDEINVSVLRALARCATPGEQHLGWIIGELCWTSVSKNCLSC